MKSTLYDEKREKELLDIIDIISQAIDNDDNNPEHYFARAVMYYQLSQQYFDILEIFNGIGDKELYFKYVNKAYEDIEKALSYNVPLDDYAYRFKLFMLKKLKRWEDAVEYGTELDKERGCKDDDWVLIGEAYFNLGNWGKAIEVYTKIINNTDEESLTYLGIEIFAERGIAYLRLEQYELAKKDFEKHIELDFPIEFSKYNIYGLLAKTYKECGDFEKAIDCFTKILADDPDNSYIYFERGSIYCDYLHKYDLAVEDFEKAIELYKGNRFYYSFCAYSYVHKGNQDELKDKSLALQDYEKAIEYYKIAHKMEFENKESDVAKFAYDATVKFAMSCKEKLLNV